MSNLTFSKKATLLILLMLLPPIAGAKCTDSNLKGEWKVYWSILYKETDGFGFYTMACDVKMNKSGRLKSGTKCYEADGNATAVVDSGRLKINKACQIGGRFLIKWDDGSAYVEPRDTQMARDKITAVGQGYWRRTERPVFILINMVKK